jgi:hypothetical protein
VSFRISCKSPYIHIYIYICIYILGFPFWWTAVRSYKQHWYNSLLLSKSGPIWANDAPICWLVFGHNENPIWPGMDLMGPTWAHMDKLIYGTHMGHIKAREGLWSQQKPRCAQNTFRNNKLNRRRLATFGSRFPPMPLRNFPHIFDGAVLGVIYAGIYTQNT